MQNRDLTHSEQRLVNIIRFTQLAMVLGALVYFTEALINAKAILNTSLVVLLTATVIVELAIRCVNSSKKAFGFSLFLTVITCALFTLIWSRGGLYSSGIVGVPIIIMFSVLYGRMKDVLFLLVVVSLYFVYLAQSPFAGTEPLSSVLFRLPLILILMCIGGYVCWAIGSDMRKAFQSLHEETKKLTASQEAIGRLSKTDFLTGLVNAKQANFDYEALLTSITKEQQVYFYFIDLDGFKEINDLFDHKTGDNLLILIADRLKAVADDSVNVCRLSGDEFIIFYADSREHIATSFAKKLVDTISEPHSLFGASAQITASIGIATTRTLSFSSIRKKASMAMYQSKREMTCHYYIYSDELEEQYMRRMYILQGLQDAVKDGRLALHYQPKVDLKTKKIKGVEALVRWVKGNPREYNPEEFMAVIESTELVHELGDWVIREACMACKKWHRAGHLLSVAVNVSVQQLLQPNFAESVQQTLVSLELDPSYLEIELTERFFIDQNEVVKKQLASLRQLGICLTIDDFGSGYSNVSYLMDLDANVLKLDKSFIDKIHTNESVRSVVKAVINIAKAGKMKVVAEGIETATDIEVITELGCDVGQGYFWSKPVNQQALIPLLNRGFGA